jgi:hypothetical protein
MRVHLRYDQTVAQHTQVSLFVDGELCGQLVLSPEQAIWLQHILMKGCQALRLPGEEGPFAFLASGSAPVVDAARMGEFARKR